MDLIEFFGNHTFRMVFFGTSVIGLVAGALGAFAYLRKQSLISDVIAHSALRCWPFWLQSWSLA